MDGSFIFAIAMLITSFVVQAVIQPKAQKPRPAMFSEFDFPQVEENTPQSVIFGDCWTEDWIVLWYGNYRTKPIKGSSGK